MLNVQPISSQEEHAQSSSIFSFKSLYPIAYAFEEQRGWLHFVSMHAVRNAVNKRLPSEVDAPLSSQRHIEPNEESREDMLGR